MKSLAGLSALLLLALSAGCATVSIPEADRAQVTQHYKDARRQLAFSLWTSAFFRDESHRLLSTRPPDEVELVDKPDGKPIIPGLARGVLPAGTSVKVVSVTFPSTWENVNRPIPSPRDRIWVELAVEGQPAPPTFILLVRQDAKSANDVITDIDKLLTDKPLDAEVKTLPEQDQKAIATKELVPGISLRGLELAFGTPNLRKIVGDGKVVNEDWTWRSDDVVRSAHLKDGVVVTVDGPPVKHEASAAVAH